ncbi:beta-phosphoglucomutase [Paenibacillus xerothermodurans]|uniref:Beta-phosphoglucomutase n=1 Tax=Paenibacillus xerothermodurans TaxID=1977292 RepID=A0A2W1ND30_PAEXE|nr:beta-phosphoglucomutase [Paenibacillus xerothermodurans]PZE21844.1 beta-phosphoglucomutase [Paenibacillus xerothermodurans]
MKSDVNIPSIYPYTEWSIREDEFLIQNNMRNEAVFAVGNGYIGMRGNFEEEYRGPEGTSISGTYLNGFYDSEPIHYPEDAYGYARNTQTMLNVTDTKIIDVLLDGERFNLFTGKILNYRRELHIKRGHLTREVEWESPTGKRISIKVRRIVCLQRKHVAAIHYEVTPVNFDGHVTFESMINGEVTNLGGKDDPRLGAAFAEQALRTEELDAQGTRAWIRHKTKNTGFTLVAAIDHDVLSWEPYNLSVTTEAQKVKMSFQVPAKQGHTVALTKFITYHTSRDIPVKEIMRRANDDMDEAKRTGFPNLETEQQEFLDRFWHRADVQIEGDPALQQGIRFNAFQLLQSAGRDAKTNIGAKGLTGEGYEGHYFWDTEIYVLPFFTYTNPEIGRGLLEYRYSILDKARDRAREMSQNGALYAWRTINGEETSAYYPAGTAQVHINADIIYAVQRYVNATGDEQFLLEKGAEMAFETARFWVDFGYFNPRRNGLFCIDAVTGPDEYTAIVSNNAYTNLMAQENLAFAYNTAIRMQEHFPEQFRLLSQRIDLGVDEIEQWKLAADRMYVPYDEELGITEQHEGFLDKEKWDFANTPKENYPLLLHYHPLVIYRHQVLKQADVVLALFLQSDHFTLAEKIRNYRYYEAITTHDSSLSPCIHSIVAAEIGLVEQAYDYFHQTARMDLDDINQNVKDGLHTAAMAGAWLSIVHGFGGMRDFGGELHFDPVLPEQWTGCGFRISYKGRLIDIHISRDTAAYTLLEGSAMDIVHRASKVSLLPGRTHQVSLLKRLEAAIFDLDGVITDTAELHYLAWKKLADELGIPFDRQVNERLKGVGRMGSLELILQNGGVTVPDEQKKEWAARKNEYYKSMIQTITPDDLLPGILPLLEELKAEGIKMAIASASENAPVVLDKLGVRDYFIAVIDPKALPKGKPEPDIFLAAADQLGIEPGNCVGIEDSSAGITAIKTAQMKAVGIGSGNGLAEADIVLDGTEKLNLAMLRKLFE